MKKFLRFLANFIDGVLDALPVFFILLVSYLVITHK